MSHSLVTLKHQAQIVTLSVSSGGNFYPIANTDVTLNTLAQSLTIDSPTLHRVTSHHIHIVQLY